MNIETQLLPQLSQDLVSYMAENQYAGKTLVHYRCTHNQFLLYLNGKNLHSFDLKTGISFLDEHYSRERKTFSRQYYTNLLRRIYLLFEFYENGKISTKRLTSGKDGLHSMQWVLDVYDSEQQKRGLAKATLESKKKMVATFLMFLESLGYSSLEMLKAEDVYHYLESKKEYTVSTREGVLYTLRGALKLFADSGFCSLELKKLFPQISTHPEEPVPSCFSTDELRSILHSVDRSTKIGKRDYAVLLLASFLGIRAGDIRLLKVSSIKWESGTIEFTQSKTGRFLQLPLLPEVKLGILDYMKNSRPKSDLDYLFLKQCAPFGPFSWNSNLYYVLQKYLGGVDLKGRRHGLHSLRFSAAGNMLSGGTPITTICNVLGHGYSDTTRHYLKIDVENLRRVALEVEP